MPIKTSNEPGSPTGPLVQPAPSPAVRQLRAEITRILAAPTPRAGAKPIRTNAEYEASLQRIGLAILCRARTLGIPDTIAETEAATAVAQFKARLDAYRETARQAG